MEAIPLPNPARVESLGGNKYKLTLEPLYPGYGVTLGNALRRVLLSSMPGAAITGVKIKFVDHEFSTVPHVAEDVLQLILNFKRIQIRSHSADPVRLKLKFKGEGVVTAAAFEPNSMVEILNPEAPIATLDSKNAEFDAEVIVERGRGYVPVEAREDQKLEVGMLAIDAVYTPVRSVYFDVSNVRVGQFTNFDKLDIVMETSGTITGAEAVDIASNILVDHFKTMFNGAAEALIPIKAEVPEIEEESNADEDASVEEISFDKSDLDEYNFSTRARNAFAKNGITNFESLKKMTNDQIGNMAGLGKKTVDEILTILGRM